MPLLNQPPLCPVCGAPMRWTHLRDVTAWGSKTIRRIGLDPVCTAEPPHVP